MYDSRRLPKLDSVEMKNVKEGCRFEGDLETTRGWEGKKGHHNTTLQRRPQLGNKRLKLPSDSTVERGTSSPGRRRPWQDVSEWLAWPQPEAGATPNRGYQDAGQSAAARILVRCHLAESRQRHKCQHGIFTADFGNKGDQEHVIADLDQPE